MMRPLAAATQTWPQQLNHPTVTFAEWTVRLGVSEPEKKAHAGYILYTMRLQPAYNGPEEPSWRTTFGSYRVYQPTRCVSRVCVWGGWGGRNS